MVSYSRRASVMSDSKNHVEPDAFALKIIEMQYTTIRSEIEYYLGKMYDVLRLSLATIPLFAGALIALIADQGTWEFATERPILLGLFCLLSPIFLVVCIYLGNLGVAQYKAVTRAADYLKVHFEDYIFQPILGQLNKEKDSHIFKDASFDKFLFWENYLSQHGTPNGDNRVRNDYDSDKHVMFSFLVFLSIALLIISAICIAAFIALLWNSNLLSRDGNITYDIALFEGMIFVSVCLFIASAIWAVVSFRTFFKIICTTGALNTSITGGQKTN